MAGMTPPGGNYGQDPFIDLMMGGMSKGKGPRPGGADFGPDISYGPEYGAGDPRFDQMQDKFANAPPWMKQMLMQKYWMDMMNKGNRAGPAMRQG